MTDITKYMNKIIKLIDTSEDPYAKKFRDELISEMRRVATENWVENGEPELTPEQVSDIYYNVVVVDEKNEKSLDFKSPIYKLVLPDHNLKFDFFPN